MWRFLVVLLGITQAYAQAVSSPSPSYLIYPNQAACLARSKTMCQAMKCDGVQTIYWWDCSTGPLSAGTVGATAVAAGSFAMRIEQSGTYSATTSNAVSGGTQGLSASEQLALVSATAIAPVLPVAAQSTQAIP